MLKKTIVATFVSIIVVMITNVANAETIHLEKNASVVSLVFSTEPKSTLDTPMFQARFGIKWGAYEKNFNPTNYSGNHIIVRFTDMDGAGYNMEVTTKGQTKLVEHYQGKSLQSLKQLYPYATIVTCGSTIHC